LVTLAETKTEFNNWLSDDATISFLEKAQAGKTTLDDISDALDEYKRLYEAGLASPAEVITLHRAFPNNKTYTEAAEEIEEEEGSEPMVVGGPASVELVDREGHLITTDALKKAFKKFMKNFRARNVMVMHSDVQVGHALPAYISKNGNIFKSGVDEKGLFFISELRGDTRISNRVRDQIKKGGMSSYSIAGSATKSKDIKKSDGSNVLQVDDMELAEVTICEKGVNQGAHFELLKSEQPKQQTPQPTPEVVVINKEDIPSYTEMFNDWMSKAPMMAGAAGKMPTNIKPPAAANVTGNVGMPIKMMEKRKQKINPYAIATAAAKKKGFKNFKEDSKGDKYRDKVTEGIKESIGMKKGFLSKDSERMPAQSGKRRTFGDLSKPKVARTRQADTGPSKFGNPDKFIPSPPKGVKTRRAASAGQVKRSKSTIGRQVASAQAATPKITRGGAKQQGRRKKLGRISGALRGGALGAGARAAGKIPRVKAARKKATGGIGAAIARGVRTAPKLKRAVFNRRTGGGQKMKPVAPRTPKANRIQRLTGARGRMMENSIVKSIVKSVFGGQVWDVKNERWVSRDEISLQKQSPKGRIAREKAAREERKQKRLKAEAIKRQARGQGDKPKRVVNPRTGRKIAQNVPKSGKPSKTARQKRMEKPFRPPKPVGAQGFAGTARGRQQRKEAEARKKRLGIGTREAKGPTMATQMAKPKRKTSTATVARKTKPVSTPKKAAGSPSMALQQQRPKTRTQRKGTFKPTKTGGKIGGVAARPESGRVQPKTVTQKLGRKTSRSTGRTTRRPSLAQGAAASIAASKKALAAKKASRRLASGAASRKTG